MSGGADTQHDLGFHALIILVLNVRVGGRDLVSVGSFLSLLFASARLPLEENAIGTITIVLVVYLLAMVAMAVECLDVGLMIALIIIIHIIPSFVSSLSFFAFTSPAPFHFRLSFPKMYHQY